MEAHITENGMARRVVFLASIALGASLVAGVLSAPAAAAGCLVDSTKDDTTVTWSGRVTEAYKVLYDGDGFIAMLPAGCSKPDDVVDVMGKAGVFGGTAARCQAGATVEVRGRYNVPEFFDERTWITPTRVRCR